MNELPPRNENVTTTCSWRKRVGGSLRLLASVALAFHGCAMCASADDPPVATENKSEAESAAESLVIDPAFSAELFRDRKTPQKTLPDADEALAGDGGKMPEVAADEPGSSADEAGAEAAHQANANDADDPLSPELRELRAKVRRTLGYYFRRKLNTRDHTPWEVFHQIVAYGAETEVLKGGPQGEEVDAVRWLCDNHASRGQKLMFLDHGKLALGRAKGIQGHYGQFLAILAQHDTPRDFPIEVDGRKFTVADLIQTEQRTCKKGEELTFKLIAFSHYLRPGASWKNERGETWTLERVLRDEIGSPIRGAACGGTHRLMGLSYAVRRREELKEPLDGEFGRASAYLKDYQRYAFSLQNDDGSFSTEWFSGKGNRDDRDRKLQTTGHITEWLAYSLAEEHLTEPQMTKAIDFLATLLESDRKAAWAIGPLGHSLHALAMYDERVFVAAEHGQDKLAQRPEPRPKPSLKTPESEQAGKDEAEAADDKADE